MSYSMKITALLALMSPAVFYASDNAGRNESIAIMIESIRAQAHLSPLASYGFMVNAVGNLEFTTGGNQLMIEGHTIDIINSDNQASIILFSNASRRYQTTFTPHPSSRLNRLSMNKDYIAAFWRKIVEVYQITKFQMQQDSLINANLHATSDLLLEDAPAAKRARHN